MHRASRGATGTIILIVLVLVAVAVLATNLASRVGSGNDDRDTTYASLNKAAAALEAYAGATLRLPCPADPTDPTDAGVEVTSGAGGCAVAAGSLPWKTIGMRRLDAYDAWAHKISYRVYIGNAGSLVQAGGVNMSDCDTSEPFPTAATATVGNTGVGGLCQPGTTTLPPANTSAAARSTPPSAFLAGKGLTLTDYGTTHNDVAYVLISHGFSGLGAYTSSGAQLPLPSGDEKDNTKDTGPFHIEAFSPIDTKDTSPAHFDDLLVYRTISDLATKANLAPRNWPDTILAASTFDKSSLNAALGSNPKSDTGQSTINFGSFSVSAFNSSVAQDISYVKGSGSDPDSIGGTSSGTGLLQSPNDSLQFDFVDTNAQQFAFTLGNFSTTGTSQEQVQVAFYNVVAGIATQVTTVPTPLVKQSCDVSEPESFSLTAPSTFNRVVLTPVATTTGTVTSFSVSEIRTCVTGATCQTSLSQVGGAINCS
jgi:hypothetical protein